MHMHLLFEVMVLAVVVGDAVVSGSDVVILGGVVVGGLRMTFGGQLGFPP